MTREEANKLITQACERTWNEKTCKEIFKALSQEPCDDAVSREAVLKIIDGWYEQNKDAENIEDLIVLITYMDSVTQKSGKWIDIDEQKPDVGISVLVCDDEEDIYLTHITSDGVFFDEWGNKIKGIVAWMPLPEPYKAESEEQTE